MPTIPLRLRAAPPIAACLLAWACRGATPMPESAHGSGGPEGTDTGSTASPADAGASTDVGPADTTQGVDDADPAEGTSTGETAPPPIDPGFVVDFDGAQDWLGFGHSRRLLFETGETISISGWLNPTAVDGADVVIGRPAPCGNPGNFQVDFSGGRLRLCYMDAAQSAPHCALIAPDPLPLSQWSHFAVTYRYGDPQSLRGYVDGVLTNEGQWSAGDGAAPPWVEAAHPVEGGRFGGCETGEQYYYQGQMYRLGVYDRALTREEIEAHAQRTDRWPCHETTHGEASVPLSVVDDAAIVSATFQSHNQKVVANGRGIFTTHVRSRNEAYTAQQWRLSQSTDGGQSFATIYEEVAGTNPPALETDHHDNLYLMRQNYGQSADSTLMIFSAADDYATPTSVPIPGGDSGKYAMLFDPKRERLVYFSLAGEIYGLSLAGEVLWRQPLIVGGPTALPQYPHLTMDAAGMLYAAWTTVRDGEYLYWNIGAARSPDGGESWETLDGAPLSPPFACDETSPATAVTLPAEHPVQSWLWSFVATPRGLHLAYEARLDPRRQSYVRFDTRTGLETARTDPAFAGRALSLVGLDGAAIADRGAPRRILFAGRVADPLRVGALQSTQDGAHWMDHGVSEAVPNAYAIGAFREVTDDGRVIGTFTDAVTEPPRVMFFATEVRADDDPVACL